MEAGTVKTLMSLAILALLIEFSKEETHVVGAPNGGWDTSSNLQSWAKAQKFSVGDSLSFQYGPPHSVFEVNEADYNSCQTNNPIKVYTGGSTLILLTAPGKRYFICGTSNHCDLGMKLEVDITTTSQSPPANPTPPASPSTLTPPPQPSLMPPASPSTLTPPPQPSLMPPPSPSTLTAPPHPSPQPAISSTPNISPSKPPASTSPRVPTTESRSMEPSESPQLSRSLSNPPQPHVSMANDDYLQVKLPIGLAFGLAMILAF